MLVHEESCDTNREGGALLERPMHTVPDGVAIGTLADISPTGEPLVSLSADAPAVLVEARSTIRFDRGHIGRGVVLAFEGNRVERPIILGVLEPARVHAVAECCSVLDETTDRVTLSVDGHRVVVSAQDEIILRCGAASITLTKAGKVVIRGHYVSNNATGVNRITGGSIELN
jgi:hypothetical protein